MTSDAQSAVPPLPRPSIFLSYASADRAAARALRDTLAEGGLDVWLDEEELAGGEAWDAKIRNQIRTCTYFMPIISATTEVRREGYFRREWRFAVERTLDLADDVMFLVPVVIDGTRDHGARVPEKFLTVQWLRAPGGAATAEMRALAARLATGEAVAVSVSPTAAAPTLRSMIKDRKAARVAPPFPPVPPFPEPGHRSRFCYDLVIWAGRMVFALWVRLPKVIRVVASVVIVFNLISWLFRDRNERVAATKDIAKEITSSLRTPELNDRSSASETIKSLVGTAASVLQAGRPVALITFSGSGDGAEAYAESIFDQAYQALLKKGDRTVALSPVPLDVGDDDDDVLARGTKLESKFVLTGAARRPAPGQPLVFTAKLYSVKQRTVVWTETYDAAQIDATTAAKRLTEAVAKLSLPPEQP